MLRRAKTGWRIHVRLVAVVAALLWLCIGRAAAQPSLKLQRVVVTSEEGLGLDEALLGALRELFARVGLSLVDSDEGKDEGLLARVRIQRDFDAATVRVFSVTDKKLASTHRVPRAETDALFRETIAHVVLGAVEPLVVERLKVEASLPVQSEQPQPPPAPSEPTAKEARSAPTAHYGVGLGAGPLYMGELWGTRILGRADAYVATRVPSVFGITMGGVLPRTRERAAVHSELKTLFARLHAGVEPWLTRVARLGVLLSFGIDALHGTASPKRMMDVLSVAAAHYEIDYTLGALLQLRFPLWQGLELQTTLGCDLALNPHQFSVRDGARETTLFAPSRARPYAALLVAWSSL